MMVWKNRGFLNEVREIITYNASEMALAMAQLLSDINKPGNGSRTVLDFHIRCIAQTVNLAVNDCLQPIHSNIDSVRGLLSSVRSFVKRRDMYESIQNSLCVNHELPCFGVPTRWSSTFHMIQKACKARRILDALTTRCTELRNYSINSDEWERVVSICTFLQSAAGLNECQSGSSYVTLIISVKAFKLFQRDCKNIGCNDKVLKPIAEKMLQKPNKYQSLVCS